MENREWMTYGQVADRLGLTSDAIRHRARKENWQRQSGNDGKVRVIPPFDLPDTPPKRRTDSDTDSAQEILEIPTSAPDQTREIRRLEDHLETLQAALDDARAELKTRDSRHAVETDRLRAEAEQAHANSRALVEKVISLTGQVSDAERGRAADRETIGRLEAQLEAEREKARRSWWWWKR